MDKTTELIISNLLGLVIGLGTSFFSWWVLYHRIVPDVRFAEFISKIPAIDGSGYRYRVKFKNVGRRAMLDVHVIARLAVDWKGKDVWSGYYVPLSDSGERRHEMPKIGRRETRVLDFYSNSVLALRGSAYFPADLREKCTTEKLTLDDLLAMKERAIVKVYVFGYDEFSGTRKLFESKFFAASDVRLGGFSGLDFLPQKETPVEAQRKPDDA